MASVTRFQTNVEPSDGNQGRTDGELVRASDWWKGVLGSEGLVDGPKSRAGIGRTSAENGRVLHGDWLEGSGGDLQEGLVTTQIHASWEGTRAMASHGSHAIGGHSDSEMGGVKARTEAMEDIQPCRGGRTTKGTVGRMKCDFFEIVLFLPIKKNA